MIPILKMRFFVLLILLLPCSLGNAQQGGLKNSYCDIWRDSQGIPHIHVQKLPGKSSNEEKEKVGIACLGYLHGKDRAWEMDFFRRTVQGRKAEVFGKDFIRSDFFLRLLGLQERADLVFHKMSSEVQNIFFAYTEGVNRGMQEAVDQGVYEFVQLGYRPDPWRPEDTLGLFLLQSFDQTQRSFQNQIDEAQWLQVHGELARTLFRSEGLPWDVSILKSGEYPLARSSSAASQIPLENLGASEISFFSPPVEFPTAFGGAGMGSNNWVIGPQRSKTGNAWLANDPHLLLGHPPFWYWVHIQAGRWDVIGATFPGVPFVASGANRHLSWGLTNSFLPASQVSFVPEADLKDSKSTTPWIWFRFWKWKLPYFFTSFRRTASQLPILPLPGPKGKAMVLSWTGFELNPNDFMGMHHLMSAGNVQQADQALSEVGVPSWNFVFADDRGKTGYRAIGKVARYEQQPLFGIPFQSLSEVENAPAFQHPVKPEEMPHLISPQRGFVVTANNAQWPEGSRLSSGHAQVQGFRALRIEELITAQARHDLASIQKIQCDVQAVDARFLLPHLLSVLEARWKELPDPQSFFPVLSTLKAWDFNADIHCIACGVYRRWVSHIFKENSINTGALYRQLTQRKARDELLEKSILNSFQLALEDLKWNETHTLLEWGEIHKISFAHLGQSQLSPTFPLASSGDDNSVSPGTSHWTGAYLDQTEGPSQRLVVEMSSPPQVYSVLAGSNQDDEVRNLLDPDSEWQKWFQCRSQKRIFPVDWTKIQDPIQKLIF